jgi:hypothetical protein
MYGILLSRFTNETLQENRRWKESNSIKCVYGSSVPISENLPLIEYLKSGNFGVDQIFITTNGSASLNYYTRLAKLVNGISFSTHSEFFDEQEFFNKARAINAQMPKPHKSFHVNIMDEFWNQERIGKYCSWLQAQGISYSINVIDYTKQIRLHPILKGTYNLD